MAFSLVKDCYILRISYVYGTYILRIWYVIDSGNDKVSSRITLPHKVKAMNMGGRTFPVRYYPIAIRLRTLAFGNMVAMIVDPVNIRATCASALPTHSRSSWGPHNIYSAILCIALNPQSGDSSGAILGVRSVALLHVIDSGKKGKHKEKARK